MTERIVLTDEINSKYKGQDCVAITSYNDNIDFFIRCSLKDYLRELADNFESFKEGDYKILAQYIGVDIIKTVEIFHNTVASMMKGDKIDLSKILDE